MFPNFVVYRAVESAVCAAVSMLNANDKNRHFPENRRLLAKVIPAAWGFDFVPS